MFYLETRTELEAINTILRMVGETPVNSLAVQELAPGALARELLKEVSRAVQSEGWYFNRQRDKVINPDAHGNLNVSIDTIAVYPSKYERWDENAYYITDNKIFDVNNDTFEFQASKQFNLIVLREFDKLPQEFKEYVTMLAGMRYAQSYSQSDILTAFSDDEMREALSRCKKIHLRNSKFYFGKGGGYVARAGRRIF